MNKMTLWDNMNKMALFEEVLISSQGKIFHSSSYHVPVY